MPTRLRLPPIVLIVPIASYLSLAPALPVGPGPSDRQSSPSSIVDFDVMEKSIDDLQRAMQEKQVTSRQLVDLYLARIDAYDKHGPSLNAIMALNPQARDAADALDAERESRGPRGPLHGVPILVKDNYETIEMPTTAGSIALAAFHPARDAYPGSAAQGRRRRHPRQDEHARAGGGDRDSGLALRADEESLRSRSQPWRIERRNRRRRRRELRRRRNGQRYLRIDSQPCLAQQPRRPARHAGACQPHRHRAALEHAGHRRSDRPQHRRSRHHARRHRSGRTRRTLPRQLRRATFRGRIARR